MPQWYSAFIAVSPDISENTQDYFLEVRTTRSDGEVKVFLENIPNGVIAGSNIEKRFWGEHQGSLSMRWVKKE